MIDDENVYDYLEHFGVKGMRWGVRKKTADGTTAGKNKPSRKERRQAKKIEIRKANEKKVNDLIKTSMKDPQVLVALNGQQIVTGKEFVDHLANGGYMDVKRTRIYARQQTKTGPYVLEPRGR